MNLIYFLTDVNVDAGTLCKSLMPVFRIFGYVYLFIKILTPVLLLIFGMITMAKAIAAKDDTVMQKAWKKLTNSFIAAVSVFLVASLVGILMTLLSNEDYKPCTACVNNPFGNCEVIKNSSGGSQYTCGEESGTCPSNQRCARQPGGSYKCINE